MYKPYTGSIDDMAAIAAYLATVDEYIAMLRMRYGFN